VTGEHACYVDVSAAQGASVGVGTWRWELESVDPLTGRTTTHRAGNWIMEADVR
jgi:hypothetical protein